MVYTIYKIQCKVNDKLGVKHTTVNYRLKAKSKKFENWKYIE